ncbi:MAG: hypothetical protein Q9212_007260 [Teloschistes hypoglaucus]
MLLRSQARTERKIGRIMEALRRQGSVISTDSESTCSDTEQSWSRFGRAFEEEGITLDMAIEGLDLLKQFFMSGSIPAEAKKLEEPDRPSLSQVKRRVTQPSTGQQFHHPNEVHIDAWKRLEPRTREESWRLGLSENGFPCPDPCDCDDQKSCTLSCDNPESSTISSASIGTWLDLTRLSAIGQAPSASLMDDDTI